MKTLTTLSALCLALTAALPATAQQQQHIRPTIGIISLDAVNVTTSPIILGNMARLEVERMNTYEVLDRYELGAALQNPKTEGCYAKSCLIDMGKALKADKMLSGSVENYEKKYILTLRMIDVAAGSIERTQVTEFLPLAPEIQSMVELSVKQFFGLPVDTVLKRRLTQPSDYDNTINTDNAPRLNTTGPRMGYACLLGSTATILKRNTDQGGFGANPYLFQFGYQFETMYLNTGHWQALFEFVPTITGLDQALFIPSLTVLNGIRNNLNGWEFAIGPTFRVVQEATVYDDGHGNFIKVDDTHTAPAGVSTTKQIDSRGDAAISTGVVLALGKTFRSGRLNLPINVYFIPGRTHQQVGLSFGFNSRSR